MYKFNNNNDFILLFEKKLAEFTGAPYVVLTDSCSNAIFLSLKYFQKHHSTQETHLTIPKQTYISVPQQIIHAGYTPCFDDIEWKGNYQLGNFPLFDCAVGFKENMYKDGEFQCLSFQQKKSLPIGKGGAILLDNEEAYKELKRMSWDGRDSSIPVKDDDSITLGYHMNMIPDDAAKGVLLLNALKDVTIGKYTDYFCINTYF